MTATLPDPTERQIIVAAAAEEGNAGAAPAADETPAPVPGSRAAPLALVTGASRGLGAAMAEALAARGWHVLAVARTIGALEELDDRIQARAARDRTGGQATLAPMDITNDDAMRHLCRAAYDRWGGVDLWVHAAIHAAPLSPAGHVAGKDFERSIAANVRATAVLIGLVEPLLRMAPGGQALFFDDPRAGQPFFGAYGATKGAQMALVRSWQAEGARIGPAVHVATPAPMATALRGRFFPGESRAGLARCEDEAARILDALPGLPGPR